MALDALSSVVKNSVREDITIDSTDISNKYFETTKDIETVREFAVADYAWEVLENNKIRMIDTNYFGAGVYTIEYNAFYKRYDGADHDQTYFDYPKRAEFGLILYALGCYASEKASINANGEGLIKSKAEGDMRVDYAIDGQRGSATAKDLKKQAMGFWQNLPNAKSFMFSVNYL